MITNSKLKFSEYMQNISRSKSFGKFVLIVSSTEKLKTKVCKYWILHTTPAHISSTLNSIWVNFRGRRPKTEAKVTVNTPFPVQIGSKQAKSESLDFQNEN